MDDAFLTDPAELDIVIWQLASSAIAHGAFPYWDRAGFDYYGSIHFLDARTISAMPTMKTSRINHDVSILFANVFAEEWCPARTRPEACSDPARSLDAPERVARFLFPEHFRLQPGPHLNERS